MGKTEIFTSTEDKAANLARHGGSVETADYRYMPKFSGTQAVEQQPRRGVVSTFINKAGSILSQAPKVVGKVVGAIGGYAVKEVAELPGEFYRTATKVLPTMLGNGLEADIRSQRMATETLEKAQNNVMARYKAGQMSKEDYNKALQELSQGFSQISKSAVRIEKEADPNKAVEDFTDTAAFLFTVGAGKLASAAPKTLNVGKDSISLATKVNLQLEQSLKKIPGGYFKKLLDEPGTSAAKIALQNSLGQNAKLTASKLFIKYPLTYHAAFDDSGAILSSLSKGDFVGAAGRAMWNSLALLEGPIAAAVKGVKNFGISTNRAMFGRGSFFDELAARTVEGDRAGIMKFVNSLKETDPQRYEAFQSWGKSLQAMNLHTSRDDVKLAVDNIEEWFYRQGVDMKKMSSQEVFEGMEKYGKALESVHRDIKLGIVDGVPFDKTGQVLIGRWDRATREQFVEAMQKAGSPRKGETIKEARVRMLKYLDGAAEQQVAWTHNEVLFSRVRAAIEEGRSVKKISEAIKEIDAGKAIGKGWSKETKALLNEGGYVPVIPKRITGSRYIEPEKAGKIVTGFADDADLFDTAIAPLPGIGRVGGIMRKAGLGVQDTNLAVNAAIKTNLDNALEGITFSAKNIDTEASSFVMRRLSKYLESLPVSPTFTKNIVAQDARFLRVGEIAKALDVDASTAKKVQRALLDAYTSIPLATRGLGDKLVDFSYSIPVTGALQRTYSRIQGALRYSWNPFFRLQETTETEILSQMLSGGKVPQYFGANGVISLFFKKTAGEIDDAVEQLRKAEIFSGTLTGQGADDMVIGRITANMTKWQKKSLAGMALKLADKKGKSLSQFINDDYDELADALRVVVQYPRKSGINSPLARTINLAFFPARYNMKVAGLAAQTLAKAPPAVQLGIVNGIMDFSTWLKSDEGTQWQSDNQDAIQLFKWITPYNSIEWAMKRFSGDMPDSLGELGLMGGLPFGLITQMIDSQTDFELNTPYVDMKTGKVGDEWIPATDKARAATALQDLIGMAFNYPGRLLGLPGKSELIRKGTKAFVDVDAGEYVIKSPEDRLTTLQKKQVDYLKGKQEQPEAGASNPVFDGYSWNANGYYIPVDVIKKTQSLSAKPAPTPVNLPSKKRKSAGPKPKKIARPIENR